MCDGHGDIKQPKESILHYNTTSGEQYALSFKSLNNTSKGQQQKVPLEHDENNITTTQRVSQNYDNYNYSYAICKSNSS